MPIENPSQLLLRHLITALTLLVLAYAMTAALQLQPPVLLSGVTGQRRPCSGWLQGLNKQGQQHKLLVADRGVAMVAVRGEATWRCGRVNRQLSGEADEASRQRDVEESEMKKK